MATTAARTAKVRPQSAMTAAKRPPVSATAKAKTAATAAVKPAARASANSPAKANAVTPVASAAPANKPNRAERFLASIESVQEPRPSGKRKPWPLWRKVALWAVMLMPLYAIIIYIIGAFYFLPYELKGVGVNKSLPSHVQSVVGDISVPDQEGVFLQTSADPHATLDQILQYNDRGLQPPLNAQMVLKPTGLRYILIRQAQVSLPGDYQVFRIGPKGTDVPFTSVTAQRVKSPGIALIAISMPNHAPWPAGSYVIYVPESGLDDGTFYCFFTITS